MQTQAGYLKQLRQLQADLKVPIAYAGDIFDRWNAPAKLCNFLIDHLPPGYAVPGQHDLPYHSWDLIEDSGFMNLCKAKVLTLLEQNKPIILKNSKTKSCYCYIQGFGWKQKLVPFDWASTVQHIPDVCKIAIIHKYAHCGESTAYYGAPISDHVSKFEKDLKGFDYAIFGDNHKPFCKKSKKTTFINCGSFMRRKSDERSHMPSVCVIYRSLKGKRIWDRYYVDTKADLMLFGPVADKPKSDPEELLGSPDFIQAVLDSYKDSDNPINFSEAVKVHLKSGNFGKKVVKLVLEALGE